MWLRQHLQRSGHYVEPLDNGIADVDDAVASSWRRPPP
jgi:hypothetical protein